MNTDITSIRIIFKPLCFEDFLRRLICLKLGSDNIQRSCKWCGRLHDENYVCLKKPPKQKKNTEAVKFRSSTAWQRKREEIKKRDKYLCQVCIRGLYEPRYQYNYENLQVHHAVPIEKNQELQLENSNLITLCAKHHDMADRGEIDLKEIQNVIREQENKY